MAAYQLPPFVYPTVLMGVCAAATMRGKDDERLAAGGMLAAWALTLVTYRRTDQTMWGVFAVDVVLLALLIWIALRSPRYWPLFAAGFHFLTIFTHLAKTANPTLGGWAYVTAEIIWSYLALFAIGYGAWTAPAIYSAFATEPVTDGDTDTRR